MLKIAILNELKDAIQKVAYVFTKEYMEECEYLEWKQKIRTNANLKLKCDEKEGIDEKINRLKEIGYEAPKCQYTKSIKN